MSEEAPPPIPPQPPAGPPVAQVQMVNMTPRWIAWLLASAIMPALPWLTMSGGPNESGASVIVFTLLALALQLAASIAVAIGFSKRRALGIGGAIGMSIVIMIASVAIGSAIWFATCLATQTMDFR